MLSAAVESPAASILLKRGAGMKILHVSQGLPPFRTGGLNLYCRDLMREQAREHSVALLYPGSFRPGATRIRPRRGEGIRLFEIINPLPLPLIFGVSAPARYMAPCAAGCYEVFLKKWRFDVIHIHCLMGVHREFFEAARALGVPMVFTTHDYYPLCARCNFFDARGRLCPGAEPARCQACNAGKGLSRKAEILMQSRLYEKLKYTGAMKLLRAKGRKKAESGPHTPGAPAEEFRALAEYYLSVLRLIGLFHCNSDTARDIYAKALPEARFVTLPITAGGIPPGTAAAPHAKPDGRLRIGYLGGERTDKGLSVLLAALERLDARGLTGWELYLYGGQYAAVPGGKRIRRCGTYTPEQLPKVYGALDIAAVPSIWYETFGLVTREALSYGVPAVVSDRVGSAMLLKNAPVPLTYPAEDAAALADVLAALFDADAYAKAAEWAAHSDAALPMETHTQDVLRLYRTLTG